MRSYAPGPGFLPVVSQVPITGWQHMPSVGWEPDDLSVSSPQAGGLSRASPSAMQWSTEGCCLSPIFFLFSSHRLAVLFYGM